MISCKNDPTLGLVDLTDCMEIGSTEFNRGPSEVWFA